MIFNDKLTVFLPRIKGIANPLSVECQNFRQVGIKDSVIHGAHNRSPVSYTHLTLPTIYSV